MMRNRRRKAIVLAATLVSPAALAAIGNEGANAAPVAEKTSPADAQAAERFREAGDKACRQAVDAAAVIGERFRTLALDMPGQLSQLGEQMKPAMERFSSELTPIMRQLADRLSELARQVERSDPPENAK